MQTQKQHRSNKVPADEFYLSLVPSKGIDVVALKERRRE